MIAYQKITYSLGKANYATNGYYHYPDNPIAIGYYRHLEYAGDVLNPKLNAEQDVSSMRHDKFYRVEVEKHSLGKFDAFLSDTIFTRVNSYAAEATLDACSIFDSIEVNFRDRSIEADAVDAAKLTDFVKDTVSVDQDEMDAFFSYYFIHGHAALLPYKSGKELKYKALSNEDVRFTYNGGIDIYFDGEDSVLTAYNAHGIVLPYHKDIYPFREKELESQSERAKSTKLALLIRYDQELSREVFILSQETWYKVNFKAGATLGDLVDLRPIIIKDKTGKSPLLNNLSTIRDYCSMLTRASNVVERQVNILQVNSSNQEVLDIIKRQARDTSNAGSPIILTNKSSSGETKPLISYTSEEDSVYKALAKERGFGGLLQDKSLLERQAQPVSAEIPMSLYAYNASSAFKDKFLRMLTLDLGRILKVMRSKLKTKSDGIHMDAMTALESTRIKAEKQQEAAQAIALIETMVKHQMPVKSSTLAELVSSVTNIPKEDVMEKEDVVAQKARMKDLEVYIKNLEEEVARHGEDRLQLLEANNQVNEANQELRLENQRLKDGQEIEIYKKQVDLQIAREANQTKRNMNTHGIASRNAQAQAKNETALRKAFKGKT